MGLGTKQFSNILRGLALRNHEQKEVDYLAALDELPRISTTFRRFRTFGSFVDRARNSGHVPTGKWLSEVYNTFIDDKATVMDQHTSMLSCLIGAVDHSHKVATLLD